MVEGREGEGGAANPGAWLDDAIVNGLHFLTHTTFVHYVCTPLYMQPTRRQCTHTPGSCNIVCHCIDCPCPMFPPSLHTHSLTPSQADHCQHHQGARGCGLGCCCEECNGQVQPGDCRRTGPNSRQGLEGECVSVCAAECGSQASAHMHAGCVSLCQAGSGAQGCHTACHCISVRCNQQCRGQQ